MHPVDPSPLPIPASPFVVERPDGHLRPSPDHEWVLAAGHGGFAMGSASGVNRRKYHALLIASLNPPVDRFSCLAGLDETVSVEGPDGRESGRMHMSAVRFTGGRIAPDGPLHLVRFEKTATVARWIYEGGGARVTKELKLAWNKNGCAVRYTVDAGGRAVRMHIAPRITMRDFHGTRLSADLGALAVEATGRRLRATVEGRTLRIVSERGVAIDQPSILPAVHLDFESERHQEDAETVFIPGAFEVDLPASKGPSSFVIAAALEPDEPDLKLFQDDSREKHLARVRHEFSKSDSSLEALGPLVDAADDFLVPRSVGGKKLMTVLAGFPWFSDWGRDTMISMFGLMMTTRRFDDARGCLETFARHVSEGMIPNLFDDYGGPPQYNTVDASLWFLHAATEYLRATGDRAMFDDVLRPACVEIIDRYRSGTRYEIRMDPDDCLITAGDQTTQLTWMDAKRDGVVFTPRHGKPVEINALWHHGLRCVAGALEQAEPARAAELKALAARVGESFRALFWHAGERRLHDCLQRGEGGAWRPVPQVRPNQIFAVSLEHSPLSLEQQRGVVENVRRHLLTPMGLRTLAPLDPGYCPRFDGDMMSRDRAYHNGTVWPWLIGPYAEAVLRVNNFSDAAREEVRGVLTALSATLTGGCLGQVAEVYDAEEPRRAQGCVAQAWSVAELLRAWTLALRPAPRV